MEGTCIVLSQDLGLSPSATTVKWPSKLGQGVEPLEYNFSLFEADNKALISQGSLRIPKMMKYIKVILLAAWYPCC